MEDRGHQLNFFLRVLKRGVMPKSAWSQRFLRQSSSLNVVRDSVSIIDPDSFDAIVETSLIWSATVLSTIRLFVATPNGIRGRTVTGRCVKSSVQFR
jgi:hypothetical protein